MEFRTFERNAVITLFACGNSCVSNGAHADVIRAAGANPASIDYRMPGQDNVDISIFKSFPIHERLKVQFRAEAMNALNTPMFGRPDTNFNTPNFGKVTTQRNFPRFIQFGVRVYF